VYVPSAGSINASGWPGSRIGPAARSTAKGIHAAPRGTTHHSNLDQVRSNPDDANEQDFLLATDAGLVIRREAGRLLLRFTPPDGQAQEGLGIRRSRLFGRDRPLGGVHPAIEVSLCETRPRRNVGQLPQEIERLRDPRATQHRRVAAGNDLSAKPLSFINYSLKLLTIEQRRPR
jgi:hypothetical protein